MVVKINAIDVLFFGNK